MASRTFGPHATAYAARLSHQLELVIFDEIGFAQALDFALERSYQSKPVLTAPIIADRRSKVAFDAARHIIAAEPAYWKRRSYFDLVRERRYRFDDKAQVEHETLTKKEQHSICDVLLASDGIVVRSWAEFVRLSQLVDFRPLRSLRAVAQPAIPVPYFRPRRGANTIVVWAPELDAVSASIFAVALEDLRVPVVIACSNSSGAEALGFRARFVDATVAEQLAPFLDEAAAIIDGSADDPAAAIELAASQLPLAATFSSGAYEYIDGLYLYDIWDYRSIVHVALAGLGGAAPTVRSSIPRHSDLITDPPRLRPPDVKDPPLVSVIVSTLNRHGILPRAIDSVAQQTYPNVELVVVNDGGRPVDAIVKRVSHATIINYDKPQGAAAAQNAGFDASKGEYIVFLSDDDYLFPTHLSRLVYALERTGEMVAGGMCMDSYLAPGESPYYDLIGIAIRLYRSADPSVLHTIPHAMPAFSLVRRSAQAAFGAWNPLAPVYDDYERFMRFFERYDCLWISHVVGNMDARLDRSNHSGRVVVDDRVADLDRIWSNDVRPDRPDIVKARVALLELFRSQAASPLLPLHRGVTRFEQPKRSVYKLT